MAIIAPYFDRQHLDNNGDPLSGGTIESYEAGTSTNKDTFTTSVGDIANANPIVLDANGRASIWLETGSYKFITKDSLGNIISTVDNITGGASNVFGSTVISVSTNTNVTSTFLNNFISCTATLTLSLLDGATAGEGFIFVAKNDGLGLVTIDPDGADTIDGASTLVLNPQAWSIVVSDGTNWKTLTNNEQKNNISATTAPVVGDDSADGYSIGSHWYDVTADEAYVCLDATVGAAVWVNSTLTTAELGTASLLNSVDEDNMVSDSPTLLPTQQSVKAYVDTSVSSLIPLGLQQVAGGTVNGTSSNYDGDGILNDITGMIGITSITRTGVGVYSVVLGATMASTSYMVFVQALCDADPATPTNQARNISQYDTVTTGGFRVTTGTNTTGSVVVDAGILTFMVFGEKA